MSPWDAAEPGEDLVEAVDVSGDDRHPGVDRQDGSAFLEGSDVAGPGQRPLGKDDDRPAMGKMVFQPVQRRSGAPGARNRKGVDQQLRQHRLPFALEDRVGADAADRKSTRLNSSHGYISYAVFCLKSTTTS